MSFLIVLAIYLLGVGLLLYISGRRFGLPVLGLSAGAVLAKLWADPLTPFIAQAGIVIEKPPLVSIVAIVLTLIPALMVMMRAPKAHGQLSKIGGSLIFGFLAVLLTYNWFTSGVIMDKASKPIVDAALPYQAAAITVCLVLALIDYMAKGHSLSRAKK